MDRQRSLGAMMSVADKKGSSQRRYGTQTHGIGYIGTVHNLTIQLIVVPSADGEKQAETMRFLSQLLQGGEQRKAANSA